MGSVSLSVQVILISTGVLSLALLFKVSFPLVVYQAPVMWNSVVSWLRPPYLYFILNCIIITIAASSRFHYSHGDKDQQEEIQAPAPKIAVRETDQFHYDMKVSAAEIRSDYVGMGEATADEVVVYELRDDEKAYEIENETVTVFEDKPTVVVRGSVEVDDKAEAEEDEDEDDFFISKSTWIPPKRMESSENFPELLLPAEKPLVSARFGHRKPVRASPEGGRALRVAKPKRHETLENTWKMITEGRAMPLTRHLKKSDTFENRNHGRQVEAMDPSLLPKKSQTFKDRTNYQLPPVNNSSPAAAAAAAASGGKLRKEPSLSQDELNRRVEAFIKKFNEEMRMQRQQSLNQYKEMIVEGSN